MRNIAPHLIAWMTILVTAWIGITLVTVRPTIGAAVLGFSALRLGLWIHRLVRNRR
jgi:hypothetical protein